MAKEQRITVAQIMDRITVVVLEQEDPMDRQMRHRIMATVIREITGQVAAIVRQEATGPRITVAAVKEQWITVAVDRQLLETTVPREPLTVHRITVARIKDMERITVAKRAVEDMERHKERIMAMELDKRLVRITVAICTGAKQERITVVRRIMEGNRQQWTMEQVMVPGRRIMVPGRLDTQALGRLEITVLLLIMALLLLVLSRLKEQEITVPRHMDKEVMEETTIAREDMEQEDRSRRPMAAVPMEQRTLEQQQQRRIMEQLLVVMEEEEEEEDIVELMDKDREV